MHTDLAANADLARALAELRHDLAAMRLLAAAYDTELPQYIGTLRGSDPVARQLLIHQLSATFGMFHTDSGRACLGAVRARAKSGSPPDECETNALIAVLQSLQTELQAFLTERHDHD